MIVISLVRLRKEWIPWVTRFLFIMVLIYLLSTAFQWFNSTSSSAPPLPGAPSLFAAAIASDPSMGHLQ